MKGGEAISEYIYTRERVADWVYSAECTGEEIVRCRDCENYDGGRCYSQQWSTASLMPAHKVKTDGFCAWGEKKEES